MSIHTNTFDTYTLAADIVVSTEHTIDGRVVDVKRAVPRDMAPAPTRYRNILMSLLIYFVMQYVIYFLFLLSQSTSYCHRLRIT